LKIYGSVTCLDVLEKSKCECYIKYDGYRIPYKDNSFDMVIAAFCLHHIPHQKEILKELYRISKNVFVLEDILEPENKIGYQVEKFHYRFFHQSSDSVNLLHSKKD